MKITTVLSILYQKYSKSVYVFTQSVSSAKQNTGSDKIPPRLVCIGATHLASPVTIIKNMSIHQSAFQDRLKYYAEVFPILK